MAQSPSSSACASEATLARLEEELWLPWPTLGPAYLAKHVTSSAGYALLLTDGVQCWLDSRDAAFVKEKADVWASCVDAGVQQLARLVLQELTAVLGAADASGNSTNNATTTTVRSAGDASVDIQWVESSPPPPCLTLTLHTSLQSLPYRWTFSLSPLHRNAMPRLLTAPMTVLLLTLTAAVQRRDEELKRLRQKLTDLTPDEGNSKKQQQQQRQQQQEEEEAHRVALHTAALAVVQGGSGATLAQHLTTEVYAALRDPRPHGPSSPRKACPDPVTGHAPKPRKPLLAPLPRPRPATNLQDELLSEEHQRARRAQVQAMTAPSADSVSLTDPLSGQPSEALCKPGKKKKKLNI